MAIREWLQADRTGTDKTDEFIRNLVRLPTPTQAPITHKFAKYVSDPVGFAAEVLGVRLVPLQCQALESLLYPPFATLCPSGHEQGKTLVGACTVLWWYSTRSPAIVLTTAPTQRQVQDLLWKEIRKLARGAKIPLGLPFLPKSCRIERSADDFAVGFTSRDATSSQGQHGPNILLVVDEATGVDAEIWESLEGQFSPPGHAWLCLYNPTDTGSRVYVEQSGSERKSTRLGGRHWNIVRMSALEHPNIAAELAGNPPPVPFAMRLDKFDRLFRKWSQLVDVRVIEPGARHPLQLPTDIVWPPVDAVAYIERTGQRPKLWRPGPIAEARLLGRFPRQGINSVWSDGDWIAAVREGLPLLSVPLSVPEIGCDVARYGDDMTATAVRVGPKLMHFEEVNGQNTVDTARRCMELADQYAYWHNEALSKYAQALREQYISITGKHVPIKIDDSGVGGGVTDVIADAGYKAVPVNSAESAYDGEGYPNRRSELWFALAERARDDQLDLSGIMLVGEERIAMIDEDVIEEIRRQAMSATWQLDNRARRVVCQKDELKPKLGRSPDSIDAVNLAYAETVDGGEADPFMAYQRVHPVKGR